MNFRRSKAVLAIFFSIFADILPWSRVISSLKAAAYLHVTLFLNFVAALRSKQDCIQSRAYATFVWKITTSTKGLLGSAWLRNAGYLQE